MSGWPLRLKKDETDVSIIAKFSDPVDLEAAKLPMRMYVKDEEIEEEETAEVVKDAEYWRNRKKRRQTYRRKSQVILEDSAPRSTSSSGASSGPVGMQFEGTLSNTSMADAAETGSSTMALSRNSEAARAPFKYVLLQVVKKDVLDPSTQQSSVATEVNVIPVSEWYQFKKPSMNGQKFLDEIDEDFELEQKRAKEKLKRYKNLGRAIERAERAGGNGHARDTEEGGGGGDRFDMPAIFGSVASKSLRKGGGAGVGKKAAAGPESLRLLDENGMDLDEARAFDDYCKGDYEATRADDDEDAWGEQAILEEQDAVQAGQAVYEKSDDELMGSDDDEDDEDEDEGSDDDGGGGGARSGFVDELVESSAKEFRAMKREAADKKRSRDHLSESADDSGSDAGSQQEGIARKKRTRFAEEGVAMTVTSSTDVGDGSQASTDGTPSSPSSASAAVTIGVCEEQHTHYPTTTRAPISYTHPN